MGFPHIQQERKQMAAKPKTRKQIADQVTGIGTKLEALQESHPELKSLVKACARTAERLNKEPKKTDPVEISYDGEDILIESMPYLFPAKFGAFRHQVGEHGGEYDKERGKTVFPKTAEDGLKKLVANFFPNSQLVEAEAEAQA